MPRSSRPRFTNTNRLHEQFLRFLPRIVGHAQFVFRALRCWHTRQDRIQEVIALSWKWVRALHRDRKKWWSFVSRLADFACRAVKRGRKITGMTSTDVLSESARQRHGFSVGKLPDFATESVNPLVEALTDNRQTPVDEAVAFRIDFPAWLATRRPRDRQIIHDMMFNLRTIDLAQKYDLSPGRISQLRRKYQHAWQQFGRLPEES